MIRTGVIGVGSLGQHHARVHASLPGCRLVGVVDADFERAKEIAKKNRCEAFARPEDLLGKVDAVSIAVPTALHFEVGRRFLAAGVHCLIEKPLSIDLDEADALIATAREGKAILQVGHIERFNPAILALKEHRSEPLFIEAHRLGPYSPRNTDIDVVLELMIHDLDIVLAFVGRKVAKVDAVGLPVLSHTEDIANVRLAFEGGCVANLTASRVTTDKQRKIRIFTRDAYLSVDYLAKQVRIHRLKEGADPSQAGSLIGLARMVTTETLKIRDEEQLKLELESFVEAVRSGGAPVVTGEDGRDAVALGLEIRRQMAEHRRRVLG
ncbi:MAG TPA: Gfo/Idh/MocA family oxidoreductase [bacterium]|jgi:predicted dehydrogenase|nr:Gfo/Idh/MocA family oxidoreductase [bacterium]